MIFVDIQATKRRIVHTVQRLVVNPVGRKLPVTMLETIGRKSGQPRLTAVGGRVVDDQFWMVSEHGGHSHYVLNIEANPRVRVRVGGRWRSGTAHLLPDDDAVARLSQLPSMNSAVVKLMGSDLLTVRVDLD
ncbi:MAG: nitroreductase family deazaflavin-dependent oxidoreductase [Mycobacterium sp.]|nr:nitroreductase family deazaflavin-dependent oxidoreductase [Mycobacterium sp.]